MITPFLSPKISGWNCLYQKIDVPVIVLMDDFEKDEEDEFKFLARTQFFEGYDKADSVYDNL